MKIAWVDDELKSNTELRNNIRDIKNKFTDETLVVDEYINVGDAHIELTKNEYDCVIVDIKFEQYRFEQYKYTGTEIFDLLEKKGIHYAIYSSYDIAKQKEYVQKSSSNIIGFYEKGKDSKKLINNIIDFLSVPPFRILQISDLHYNLTIDKTNRERLLTSLEEKICDINCEKKINIITIAGDLVSADPAIELPIIRKYLANLFKKININLNCVFVVPGNHEIHWEDFTTSKLSENPYTYYAEFYNQLFIRNKIHFSSCVGATKGELPNDINEVGLNWCRELKELKVSLIGVCSNTDKIYDNGKEKGLGRLADETINFIREKWAHSKKNDEMRIFLLHHNFFQIESFYRGDENRTVINAGEVLNALVHGNCDLVLSGHSHRSEVILHQSSSLEDAGYNVNKTLLFSACGTSGGKPPGDIRKHFNLIDISQDIKQKNKRVKITPYTYDSRTTNWTSKRSTEYNV